MPQTIMDRIHNNVDPTTVSNAIYEIMMDWCSFSTRINENAPHKNRNRYKRQTLEVVLSRFLGTDPKTTREMLSEHFKIEASGR